MKKLKVLLSVLLVVCMVAGFAPLHATASADWGDWVWYWSEEYRNGRYWNGWRYNDGWYELSDKWYQVDFSPVKIPVEVNTPGTASNAAAKAAGSTVQMVDTSFSYFYNEWAGVLIIRGTGEMPSFSKEYPAPWANLKDKAVRVIIERNITKISSNAFVDFSRLKSVILPATLKSIDPDAFVWSEETRALKTFRPLERLEFSGDLDTLDKILKAANIKDLLDARIVKVTEKDIQDEIWQLTWYRIRRPVRVKYDKAGRPILIERVEDGKFFRTAITWDDTLADGNVHSPSQPLSEDTKKSGKNFTRDVVEKRETYSVNQNGVENLYEFEKNDLGQTTYFAAFHLDNGVITGGSQIISDETGVIRQDKLGSVTTQTDGSIRRVWENVLASNPTLEDMIEVLDKFGRVSKITVGSKVVVENTYKEDGRLEQRVTEDGTYKYNYDETTKALKSVTGPGGNEISYTYTDINGESVLSTKVQTQGNTTVTSYYTLYNRVAQEVFTDNTNAIQYIYSYEYDSNGVVSKRIITDKDGKLLGTDTFNSAGVRISSERTGSVPLPTLKSVRPKLGKSMTAADPLMDGVQLTDTALPGDTLTVDAASLVTEGDPAGDALLPMMTTMVRTTYDPETGSKLSETVETTDGITTSKTAYTFNNLGLLTNVSSSFTDEEGKTSDFSLKSSYDADGNIATQTEETSDFDNNSKVSKYIFGKLSKPLSLDVTESGEDGTLTARSFSTFLYRSDGGILETVTEMDADGMVANSYFINHDAPADDDAELPAEDEEVTDEDEEVTDEDEAVVEEDEKVTEEEDEEIEAGKVPLVETPAAEDDEDEGGADPADDEDDGDTDPADNEDEVGTDPADDEDEVGTDPADDEDEGGADPADDEDEVGTDPADDEDEVGTDPADDKDEVGTDPADDEDEVGTDPADDEDEVGTDPADNEDDGDTDPADDENVVGTDPADDKDEGGADPANDEDEVGTDPADDDDEVGTDPADDEGGNEEDANTTGDELTEAEKEKLRKLKALEEAEKAKAAEASQKSETPAAETKPAAETMPAAETKPAAEPAAQAQAPAPVAPAPAPVVEVPVTPVEEPAAQDVAEEAA